MFVLRLNAAAGPSRTLRALRVSGAPSLCAVPRPVSIRELVGARWASTAPTTTPSAPSTPATPSAPSAAAATPSWSSQSVLKSTMGGAPGIGSRGVKSKLTPQQWPWYPVQPPRHAGQIEEERVIYARPPGANPKIYWAMFILYASGVVMYLVLPSPEEAREKGFDGEEGTILGIPTGSFMSYMAGGCMTAFTCIAFFGLLFPTRLITRLSLIRSRPVGAPPSEAVQYLRMQHLGHGMMWGKRAQARELPVKDVSVSVIMGRPTSNGERERLSWLNLRVNSPRSTSRFSFDGYGYRLDFRQTPALEKEKGEVVLSLARIQDVFGPLSLSNPLSAAAPKAAAAPKVAAAATKK